MFGLGKGGMKGLDFVLPLAIGGAIGIFLFKMQNDKQVADMQARLRAMQETRGNGLSNSQILSYNTTPYFLHNLPTTSEWNPENLQFSGSISDAGNGYTFVIPKSAM